MGARSARPSGFSLATLSNRGVFERPLRSGVWWVCYFDDHGKRHREKIGPKALAVKVYQKRKNEIQERRFFPERLRRHDVLLTEYAKGFLGVARRRVAHSQPIATLGARLA